MRACAGACDTSSNSKAVATHLVALLYPSGATEGYFLFCVGFWGRRADKATSRRTTSRQNDKTTNEAFNPFASYNSFHPSTPYNNPSPSLLSLLSLPLATPNAPSYPVIFTIKTRKYTFLEKYLFFGELLLIFVIRIINNLRQQLKLTNKPN